MRALLLAVGVVSFSLAVAGAVLPVLPTTPFLLLAAACFVRSSPKLHKRLLETRSLGPYLRQWEEDRSVPEAAKLRAYALVAVTFSSSILFVDKDWLKIVLAGLGLAVISVLVLLKTTGDVPAGGYRAELKPKRPSSSASQPELSSEARAAFNASSTPARSASRSTGSTASA